MPFLTLNGVSLPIVSGGELKPIEIGSKQRAFGGMLLRDRRALKRQWTFTTPALTQADAQALMGIIQGQGHVWPFDALTNATTVSGASDATLTSTRGLIPLSHNDIWHIRATAEDDFPVLNLYDEYSSPEPATVRFGAVALGEAFTNALPADERDCEGDPATDFAGDGSVMLTTDTNDYFSGSKSLHVETFNGTYDGAFTSSVSCGGSEDWTGAVWIRADGVGSVVEFKVEDDQGAYTSIAVYPETDEWHRIWVTHTTDSSATNVFIRVGDEAPGDSSEFWVDNFSLVQSSHITPWGDPSYSADSILQYDATWLANTTQLSVGCWSNGDATNSGRILTLHVPSSDLPSVYLRWAPTGSGRLEAGLLNEDGDSATGNDSTASYYGIWYHVVLTYDRATGIAKVYRNGALDFSLSALTMDVGALSRLSFGCDHNGNYTLHGELDDAFCLPYVLEADQITALYNSGASTAIDTEAIVAAGDFAPDDQVLVRGEVTQARYVSGGLGGTWNSNNLAITFVLEEI